MSLVEKVARELSSTDWQDEIVRRRASAIIKVVLREMTSSNSLNQGTLDWGRAVENDRSVQGCILAVVKGFAAEHNIAFATHSGDGEG